MKESGCVSRLMEAIDRVSKTSKEGDAASRGWVLPHLLVLLAPRVGSASPPANT